MYEINFSFRYRKIVIKQIGTKQTNYVFSRYGDTVMMSKDNYLSPETPGDEENIAGFTR